jgi:hypothetical protein
MGGMLGALVGSYAPVAGSFEPIATITPNGVSTATFSSIPSTYSSLQLRMNVWGDGNGTIGLKFNSDSSANYSFHHLYGNGSSAAGAGYANRSYVELTTGQTVNLGTGSMFVLIIDIDDYKVTSKNKTFRTFFGKDSNGSGVIGLGSGSWRSTAAINSIQISLDAGNFISPATLSLYGIKG